MNKLILLLVFIVSAVLVGCAPKQLDRAQFLVFEDATQKAMTRTYSGFNQEQLIAAAEKALLHSDKDYRVSRHRRDGFSAGRQWTVYAVIAAVIGHDSWNFQVDGDKITATAWFSGGQGITPMPGMSTQTGQVNTMTANTSSVAGNDRADYYLSPPLYDLFFARMEYFLGLRSDWAPCGKVDKTLYHYGDGIENGNDPLCYHARSEDPTKASARP